MKITVIGAGNSGLTMAADLALAGHEIILWNRTEDNIKKIKQTKKIFIEGQIEGEAQIKEATSDLNQALAEPELVIVTTPAFSHRELAFQFSKSLQTDAIVILSPGRTCGAIEFDHYYNQGSNLSKPIITEAQTVFHTCRKISEDRTHLYAIKEAVYLAGLGELSNQEICSRLPLGLQKHFQPATSMIQTSIGNVGMILHCAPLLLNSGRTEDQSSNYLYYHEGITPRIAEFLENTDRERIRLSEAMNFPVESTSDWVSRSYKSLGNNLYEKIQNTDAYSEIYAPTTLKHRYIYEDIPYGLVPLEALGKKLNLDMSYTGLIIELASKLMHENFRERGRYLREIEFSDILQKLVRRDDPDATV